MAVLDPSASDHPGKQHRPDDRFRGRNAVGDHVRPSRPGDGRLVDGFPYWLSVAVIGIGGILGVMYSVPLRRALVTGTDLPYPEGVAAAEVLKVGAGIGGAEENRRGLVMIVWSSIASAGYSLLPDGLSPRMPRRASASARARRGLGQPFDGADRRRPLVGLAVGIAMFVGLVISWAYLVPHYTRSRERSRRHRPRRFRRRRVRQQGPFHRRRDDRRRRDLDFAQDHRPDRRAESAARSPQTASARPGAAKRCRSPSATSRSASSPPPSSSR